MHEISFLFCNEQTAWKRVQNMVEVGSGWNITESHGLGGMYPRMMLIFQVHIEFFTTQTGLYHYTNLCITANEHCILLILALRKGKEMGVETGTGL